MADYTIYPTKAAVVSSAYPGTHQSIGAVERMYYDRGSFCWESRAHSLKACFIGI